MNKLSKTLTGNLQGHFCSTFEVSFQTNKQMFKPFSKYLILAVVSLFSLSGCIKDPTDSFPPDPQYLGPPVSLADFFVRHISKIRSVDINSNDTVKIKTRFNNILTFYPGIWVYADNSPVTGNVTISYRDIATKSDMIFSKATTLSGTQILDAAGTLYITASKAGVPVFLRAGATFRVQFLTTKTDKTVTIFQGSAGTDGFIDWKQRSTPPNALTVDSTGKKYYDCAIAFLNWVRVAKVDVSAPVTALKVDQQNLKDYTDIMGFVVFKNQQSVVRLTYDSLSGNYSIPNMPVGYKATIVMLASKNNQFYASLSDIVISSGIQVFSPLVQHNEDFLVQRLQSLD